MAGKKKILVIEDEEDIRRTLQVRLEMEGYDIVTASDGKEGLDKAKSSGEDLIILDLKLPVLPGEEICRKLRKEEEFEDLPIIMLTAKDTDVDRIVGRAIGADAYIYKPFDMDALLAKIRSLLSPPIDDKT
jgi:DNA-binding response OmpR family regulator